MKLRPNEPGLSGQVVSDRYGFIDNAKAIGIILIVCGHGKGLPAYLSHFIFSFHVPLFFFISGFLLKSGKLNAAVGTNIKKILRTLGVPYVLFFLLAWIYWLATRHIGSKASLFGDYAWYAPIAGLFDRAGGRFVCRSAAMVLSVCDADDDYLSRGAQVDELGGVDRPVCRGRSYPVAVMGNLVYPYLYRLPLGLDNAWIGLAFYALGQYVREKNFFSDGWHDCGPAGSWRSFALHLRCWDMRLC